MKVKKKCLSARMQLASINWNTLLEIQDEKSMGSVSYNDKGNSAVVCTAT